MARSKDGENYACDKTVNAGHSRNYGPSMSITRHAYKPTQPNPDRHPQQE
jgi:hypothetical protein